MAAVASAEALLRDGAEVTDHRPRPSDALDRMSRGRRHGRPGRSAPRASCWTRSTTWSCRPACHRTTPLAAAAVAAGHRRLLRAGAGLAAARAAGAPPWLAVTGTNGKTTTVTMLAAILRAAGLRTAALGNIGEPLVDLGGDHRGRRRFDVLAVELSSFQLHWSSTLAPQVGALLNVADDHLEWHGTFDAYVAAKFEIWRSATPAAGGIAIGNLDDPLVATGLANVHRPGGRLHARRAEAGSARRRRRHAGRLRRLVGRARPPMCRCRSIEASRDPAAGRAQRRATRSPPPRWPARTACGPRAVRIGPGRDTRPSRTATRPWHVAGVTLRRRQQGDQPARGGRVAGRVPVDRVGRRWPAQGRRRRRPRGIGRRPAAGRRAARRRSGRGDRGTRATRAGCPRRRRADHG